MLQYSYYPSAASYTYQRNKKTGYEKIIYFISGNLLGKYYFTEKRYIVLEVKVSPGLRIVEGKAG